MSSRRKTPPYRIFVAEAELYQTHWLYIPPEARGGLFCNSLDKSHKRVVTGLTGREANVIHSF